MALPLHLVLVRHGESIGNLANRMSRQGDNSYFTPEFKDLHSSRWWLTPRGEEQAVAAGDWIRANVGPHFDRHYTSSYIRAQHTAALLGLPRADWRQSMDLREADWGIADVATQEEREGLYAQFIRWHRINRVYGTPAGGESFAMLCLRIRIFLDTLHRECYDKKVVVVCHGLVIWAFRALLERFTEDRYLELENSDNPWDRVHNCQILEYRRTDPETGMVSTHADWFRSTCPWDTSRSNPDWQKVVRRTFANEDLLANVRSAPRIEFPA